MQGLTLALGAWLLAQPASDGGFVGPRLAEPAGSAPAWQWLDREVPAGGNARVALLVGVGRHSRHPIWDLDWIGNDLDELGKVLSGECGYRKVERLEDTAVTRASIETKLRELARSLEGEGNLLLLYWSGHGYVDATGECRYFLPDSDETSEGEYTGTLGELELAELLSPLRRGGKARVLLVADACRVERKAPARRRRPREVTVADATLYSARRGEYAAPARPGADGKRRSAFTESLVGVLGALSKRPSATLEEVAKEVARDLSARGFDQRPEVAGRVRPSEVKVFDHARLALGVEAVDRLTKAELRGSVVSLAGLERRAESPAVFSGLAPGKYRVEVSLPKYFREVVEVELTESLSGRVLRVRLEPSYDLIEGRVVEEGGSAVAGARCSLEGSRAGFLRGHHTHEATTDAEGRYRFRVPPGARVTAVVVEGARRAGRRLPLELSRLSPHVELQGARSLSRYELGDLVLPAGEVITVKELGLRGSDAERWRQAEAYRSEGSSDNLDLAIAYYESLREKVAAATRAKLEARLRSVYGEYLSHLGARGQWAEGARVAEGALKVFPGDEALGKLRDRFARESIPSVLRRGIEAARRSMLGGDFERAEKLYAAVGARGEELTEYYRAQVRENLQAVREKLYLDAFRAFNVSLRGGDYATAAGSYGALSRLRPEDPALKVMKRKIEKYLDSEPPVVEARVLATGGAARKTGEKGRVELFATKARVEVTARDDRALAHLELDGKKLTLERGARQARVEVEVDLAEGENRLEAAALDEAGNRGEAKVVVVRLAEPPYRRVEGFTHLAKNAQGYEEYRHEKTGLVFVLLPGGKFRMGSPGSEGERGDDEGPVHEVTLSPFLLAKTEVPQSAWERVMGSNPSGSKGADRPVEQVSWNDCREFCEKTGLRLPSEAQWEYACRAGSETPFSFGGTITPGQVNYAAEGRFRVETVAVGSLPANGFGLHEMHGNVHEWCEDVYDAGFYEKPEAKGPDPVSTSGSSSRVSRGGDWASAARFCRSADRDWYSPSYRTLGLGLRPSRPLR